MAITRWPGGVPWPMYPTAGGNTAPNLSNITLDANGEKFASIYAATAAKAIHTIHFRTITVTTGDTLDVRVETVDTASDGNPTGTLWGTTTNGSAVVASSDDNVWKSVTLTADATLAIGDVFALVAVNGAAGVMNLAAWQRSTAQFPYGNQFAAAAWTKNANLNLIIPQYSDGTFEPIHGLTGVGGPINTNTFKSDDATNRRGNIFQVPSQCRAGGCWVWVDADAAFTVKLYDSDGSTVLATTASINTFQRVSTGAGVLFFPFTTAATLNPGTSYRIAIVPSGAANISAYDFDAPVAAYMDLFPGGQAMHRSVYTSNAWVETTTARTYVGLMIDGFGGGRRRIIGG